MDWGWQRSPPLLRLPEWPTLKMVWTRPSAKGLRGKQACPEGLQQKRAGSLSGGPFRSRVYGFVWRVGGSCLFFFFLNSQGLACYNSSFCSRRTGYWLAGPAVTSEKDSQSEQDSACLPAADCWSCNRTPNSARHCSFQGKAGKNAKNQSWITEQGPPEASILAPTWSTGKASLPPRFIFLWVSDF